MFTTLIRGSQLAKLLGHPDLILLDCRYDENLPGFGIELWEKSHLPGAVYAKLDYHLSGVPDSATGALTLPDPMRLAVVFGAWGINANSQVVVYDDDLCHAARAWAMLRWLGHEQVAVLDGGWAAWQAQGGALSAERGKSRPCRFPIRASRLRLSDKLPGEGEHIIYAGQHPPRPALCRRWKDNCTEDGHFKSEEQLSQEWATLLAGRNPAHCVHLSSHAVGACANLLAMEVAGFASSQLCLVPSAAPPETAFESPV